MSNRILRGLVSVFGGKMGVMLLGGMITPILVRILGTESYGDYAFIISVYSIIVIFLHAGISSGVRKYIAEARSDEEWKNQVFAFYFRLAIFLAIAGSLLLILTVNTSMIQPYIRDNFTSYLTILVLVIITEQIMFVSRYTLMGLQLEHYSESLIILNKILFGVFGLSLAYIGYGVSGLLAGMAIAALITGTIAVLLLRKHIDLSSIFRRTNYDFPRRRLLEFNIGNTIFIFLTASLYNTDLLLLQPLAGSEQTGLYKTALVSAELVWVVPIVIQTVFIHSSSELWANERYDEISKLVSKATRYTLSFTLLLVIGLGVLSSEFMELYFGPGFQSAAEPLLFLLPGIIGFAVARPIFAVGMGKGEFRLLIIATGCAAVINLLLNILLIPRYGMTGAAIATSIGYGSMIAFHIFTAYKIGYDPLEDLRLSKIGLVTVLTAISVFGVNSIIDSSIISLAVVPPIGFGVYLVTTLKAGIIEENDLETIMDYMPDNVYNILKFIHSQ